MNIKDKLKELLLLGDSFTYEELSEYVKECGDIVIVPSTAPEESTDNIGTYPQITYKGCIVVVNRYSEIFLGIRDSDGRPRSDSDSDSTLYFMDRWLNRTSLNQDNIKHIIQLMEAIDGL